MSQLSWQKSSFSSSDGNTTCIEVSADGSGVLRLRESDNPHTVIAPSKPAMRALLSWAKEPAATAWR
ncbi:DUF397 domain-containing protein [Streptomyces sp. NPDC050610]|uniref:DUF397 domain-containing protein n=1 Tax=Streptomyces sp. NPDC050610 TaxID=3157097 RepID=UPI003415795E